MILYSFLFIFCLIFFNVLVNLSLNFNPFFAYLIVTSIICFNFYLFCLLKKIIKTKNKNSFKNKITAHDHPIIKAAKQRLNK